ncbi:uncharacterized protein [Brachyistius frenatus]|uniref:uncharacterized protein n=1 Tax=Brachyistius frenatus TaxID=100188 RepID=UPI0037E8E14A
MKYFVLELFSLAVLGFVYAQTDMDEHRVKPGNATSSANMTDTYGNSTVDGNNNMGGTGSGGTGSGGTGSGGTGSGGTGSGGTGKPSGMTSVNGQSHIVASMSLLFGSFALQAFWQ